MDRPPRTAAAAFVAGAVLAGVSAASVPSAISYQGVLLDTSGQPSNAPTNLRFRIFRGGDDTTFPSAGILAYHESATVTPLDGVFSHLIGTGTAASDCASGPCVLDATVFGSDTVPVWIEVLLDPDGLLGSPDDDVLLPRTRVGAVAYAYHVASLDGATGGTMTGTVAADELRGRTGAVLGDAAASTTALRFEGAAGSTSVTWDPVSSELEFDRRTRQSRGLSLDPSRSLAWGPLGGNPISPHLRLNHWTSLGADGDNDGQPDTVQTLSMCYNCQEATSALEVSSEYAMHALWDLTATQGPGDRRIFHRWNFVAPGLPAFQPFLFSLDTNFLGGYANPTAKWAFRTSRTRTALSINQNGNVLVGTDAFQPLYPLDVVGAIHTDDDLLIDREEQIRFGGANALTTDAAGSALLVGTGFPQVRMQAAAHFDQGLTVADGKAMNWGPYTNPTPGAYIRQITTGTTFADGNLDGVADYDHVWGLCYNCTESAATPDVPGEYQMIAQWEMTYAPSDGTRWIEHNWDFRDPGVGFFRPLAFVLDTDFAGGYADPRAGWTFNTDRNRVALQINRNGNVRIGGNTPEPLYPLEVSGTVRATGDLRLESGGALYLDAKKALHTNSSGLVLSEDHDVVSVGNASLALNACAQVNSATQISIGECNVVQLAGGASVHAIDTCDAGRAGRVLHVVCGSGGAQVCDSCSNGNLRLAGNLNCTGDDTITLLCDGSVWRELGRSVN